MSNKHNRLGEIIYFNLNPQFPIESIDLITPRCKSSELSSTDIEHE